MLTCRNLMDEDKEQIIKELKGRDVEPSQEIVSTVKSLLETVKRSGDTALRDFTYKFDGVMLKDFEVSKDRLKACLDQVEEDFLNNLKEAKENIWFYHESQKSKGYILNKNHGVFMGQRVLPLEKVGVYVPGGTAAYPSSVLMNIIPAKVAGVSEVIMVTPPDKNGDINPYIGAAAYVAGADKVFMIGGAQAVGALAYGTESIPKVDKIV